MAVTGKKWSERRESRRQCFHAKAVVRHEDMQFSGEIRNISDRGIYVATNAPFAANDPVEVILFFQEGTAKLSIVVPGTVARIDGGGVGLISPLLDVYKLMQLELVFDMNKGETRQLVEEFCRSI